jgi:hypothetical protein
MKAWIVTVIFFLNVPGIYAQRLRALLPDYGKAQFAGSIGFVSAGAGYEFLNNHVNAELLYGYVPAHYGGPLNIATGRIILNPVNLRITPSVSLTLLNLSGFVTYHFGDQFYVKLPSYYYEGYYKWSSAIRYHVGFGSMVSYKSTKSGHGFALYYELTTNDLYIKSLRANSSLTFEDILSLGVGVKIY